MRSAAGAAMRVLSGVHARNGRHGGAELDRRAGRIVEMQGAALVRHVDERRLDADPVEVRLGLVQVFVHEHTKADALALAAGRSVRLSVRL